MADIELGSRPAPQTPEKNAIMDAQTPTLEDFRRNYTQGGNVETRFFTDDARQRLSEEFDLTVDEVSAEVEPYASVPVKKYLDILIPRRLKEVKKMKTNGNIFTTPQIAETA